jgi:hypothetical protein
VRARRAHRRALLLECTRSARPLTGGTMANPFDLLSSRWGHGGPRHDPRPFGRIADAPTVGPAPRECTLRRTNSGCSQVIFMWESALTCGGAAAEPGVRRLADIFARKIFRCDVRQGVKYQNYDMEKPYPGLGCRICDLRKCFYLSLNGGRI